MESFGSHPMVLSAQCPLGEHRGYWTGYAVTFEAAGITWQVVAHVMNPAIGSPCIINVTENGLFEIKTVGDD